MEGSSLKSVLWYILHQVNSFPLNETRMVGISYPLIPWPGVILLGYCFGSLYVKGFDVVLRRKWLLMIGSGATALFFILRGINIYGDPSPWSQQKNAIHSILSFLDVSKYPASLLFLLITLGPSILFLSITEKTKNKFTDFMIVFGRVPLFYYFTHIFIIHFSAMIIGGNWKDILFNGQPFHSTRLGIYEFGLWIIYLAWILVILMIYPLCKWYMIYKNNNKDKWWLSYL